MGSDETNFEWKKGPAPKWDKDTHLYTLIIHPDNSYEVLEDLETIDTGSLKDDFDILPPREIEDPDAVKPDDWVLIPKFTFRLMNV